MGCKVSKNSIRTHPRSKDSITLASETMFSVSEVEALYVLYRKLSGCRMLDDGLIHKEEFRHALLKNGGKPDFFVDRVFDLFDIKRNGVIEFGEFVQSLSVFHPNSPASDKISFAFKLYDLRHTGYIEREEVKEMVLAILNESGLTLPDDYVEAIVEKTFKEADSKEDGRIDQEEWMEFVAINPSLLKNMTLPYLMDVTSTMAFPSFVDKKEIQPSFSAGKQFDKIGKVDFGGEAQVAQHIFLQSVW